MSAQPPEPGPPSVPDRATIRCPRCSAPIGPDQDWCMECGAPARTRLAPTPNWQLPTVAIGAIVAIAGALLAFAFVKLTNDNGTTPAGTTPTTAVETAPATATAPPVVTATAPVVTTTVPAATTTAPAATTTAPAATTTSPGQAATTTAPRTTSTGNRPAITATTSSGDVVTAGKP